MTNNKYTKVVKYKLKKDSKDVFGLIVMVFVWITMTQVINSWYFVLFEYCLLLILLSWSYEREVYYKKIKVSK
jgi:hypothetical protein